MIKNRSKENVIRIWETPAIPEIAASAACVRFTFKTWRITLTTIMPAINGSAILWTI